jgi:hypothetical protein
MTAGAKVAMMTSACVWLLLLLPTRRAFSVRLTPLSMCWKCSAALCPKDPIAASSNVSPTASLNLRAGEEAALSELVTVPYNELRRVASRHLPRERTWHTLQTTALVHEVYLKLASDRYAQAQKRHNA